AWLLQLPQPMVHDATSHIPPMQLATAFGRLHFIPHMPQLLASVARVDSQPSPALPLQSPNPWLHVETAHIEVMHDHIACWPVQALPHIPQLARSLVRSLQKPPQQDCLPQSVPHPPQLVSSASVSTQTWLQQAGLPPASEVGQSATVWQPVWQVYTPFT